MGIDLSDVVAKRRVSLRDLSGQRVAFDAWNVLYQFLSSIRQPDGTPLLDREGNVTSHLAGVLYRTANMVEAGVRPVFVFDGAPHALKRETLVQRQDRRQAAKEAYEEALEAGDLEKARSKAQQSSRLTPPMAAQAQDLLRALGVPVVEAPGEGEAAAAALCRAGRVDAVSSQDFDALLFGAPVLVRNLAVTGRRKLPGKQVWVEVEPEEIRLEATLEALGLHREGLVEAALLVGTDFHPGVKGVGAKKAVALVKKWGGVDALLEGLGADRSGAASAVERAVWEQRENLTDRAQVRRIFLESPGDLEVDLETRGPDEEAVRALMVERHGFNAQRVDGALARFEAARGRAKQRALFEF